MKLKNTFLIQFFALMVFAIPSIATATFTDVLEDNPQYGPINYMQEKQIVKGYEDGSFQPDKPITRAEFFKMAFQTIGYNPLNGTYKTIFADVPTSSWFAPYVNKALELGLIHYNPDNVGFFPSATVSHIESLRLILPLKGIPTPFISQTTTLPFKDIHNAYTYKYIIDAAYQSGIYLYNPNSFFNANKELTRGDAAEILYKTALYQNIGEIPEITLTIDPESFNTSDSTLLSNPKFPILLNVWTKITEQYLHKNEVNQDELVYGAINGMVQTLADPYSKFENPDSALDLQNSLEGSFEGIGTILDTYEDQFIIIGVIKDSPAEKAGIKTGDIITKVDGKNVSTYTIDELLDSIKGPSGSTVKITVLRGGTSHSYDIVRSKITLDTVLLEASETIIPDQIGYISIYQFTGSTIYEFENLIANNIDKYPKGLILDLRDNPGGYLESAYNVLNHFVPEDEIISKIKTATEIYEQKSKGNGELNNIPVIILVNNNTASAAEIVASTLQETMGAKLVGTTTYGKGTVQEVSIFQDGSLLKLSIANWLTPKDINIDHIGLKPDYEVIESKDDVLGKTDSQLAKAIDLLS